MKTRIAVVALSLAATAFFVSREQPASSPAGHPDRDVETVQAAERATGAPVDFGSVRALDAPPQLAPTEDVDGRQAIASRRALAGRVTTPDGRSVAGAHVQWTPLTDALSHPALRVSDIAADSIDAASRNTTTDADGYFAFEAPPLSVEATPSVVWVSGHDHFPNFAIVEAWGSATTLELDPIEVASTEHTNVRVVDATGQPVAGAHVHQRLLATDASATTEIETRARLVFARDVATDAAGQARVHAIPANQGLTIARHGALVSLPSMASGPITLTLGGSFEAQGTVQVAGGALRPNEARVVVSARTEAEFLPLGSLAVRSNGSFGPANFAVLPGADYLFSLSGGGLEPRHETRPAPKAGEQLHLAIATRLGHALDVDVQDLAGSPVSQARIEALWEGDTNTDGGSASATTDEQGRARLEGLPNRMVTLNLRADSFAARSGVGPFLTTRSEPVELILEPAMTVQGSVVRAGHPVEQFDIVWWSNESTTRTAASFERAGGRFVLAEVPQGLVTLLTVAPNGPESEPVTVDPTIGSAVELVLPTGLQGSVRIVDGATGAPVEDAEVRLWATSGDRLLVERGAFERVGPDGRFRSSDFASGTTGLEIRAEGYAPYWTTVSTPDIGSVELGDIALFRSASATVRLVGADDLDHAAVRGWTEGGNRIAFPPFDSDGTVRLAELRPFFTQFVIELPDGTRAVVGSDLVVGDDTLVELDLRGGTALTVDLVGELEGGAKYTARVWTLDEDGQLYRTERTFRGRSVVLDRLHGASATVAISDSRERTLGVTRTDLAPTSMNSIALPLGIERRELLVVDPSGDPVQNATVTARLVGGAGWNHATTTDSAGSAMLIATASEQVVTLEHAELGRAVGLAVPPAPRSGEAARVVFESGVDLELKLLDEGLAQANVWVWVLDPETGETRADAVTDPTGVATLGRFAPGTYLAYAHSPGYWPVPLEFELDASGSQATVDVFRSGDATFDVQAAGLPAGDAEIRLHYIEEFALGLEEWISSGGIAALSREQRTDTSGTVTITGLPRGDYEWTAIAASGATTQGRITIAPHGTTAVEVELP